MLKLNYLLFSLNYLLLHQQQLGLIVFFHCQICCSLTNSENDLVTNPIYYQLITYVYRGYKKIVPCSC